MNELMTVGDVSLRVFNPVRRRRFAWEPKPASGIKLEPKNKKNEYFIILFHLLLFCFILAMNKFTQLSIDPMLMDNGDKVEQKISKEEK